MVMLNLAKKIDIRAVKKGTGKESKKRIKITCYEFLFTRHKRTDYPK